jgi:hypothetical protein
MPSPINVKFPSTNSSVELDDGDELGASEIDDGDELGASDV